MASTLTPTKSTGLSTELEFPTTKIYCSSHQMKRSYLPVLLLSMTLMSVSVAGRYCYSQIVDDVNGRWAVVSGSYILVLIVTHLIYHSHSLEYHLDSPAKERTVNDCDNAIPRILILIVVGIIYLIFGLHWEVVPYWYFAILALSFGFCVLYSLYNISKHYLVDRDEYYEKEWNQKMNDDQRFDYVMAYWKRTHNIDIYDDPLHKIFGFYRQNKQKKRERV